MKNFQLKTLFDDLARLKDGWLDGESLALESNALRKISKIFIDNYPEFLPIPLIVPTPEGNLLVEWNTTGYPSIEINIDKMTADFQHFGLYGDEYFIEKEFELSDSGGVERFFHFLTEHVK
ncbi:MAG: hypothetical protein LBR53_01675 [Deltaproteobacteria bacterium]|jgi:hypothetical protein|nr:hypothetical protein [Deltaproteobacteria bacterium]